MGWQIRCTHYSLEVIIMSHIAVERLSTAALVDRVQRGDARAFELLWERSEPRVHSVVRAYVTNREDREDLVREVPGRSGAAGCLRAGRARVHAVWQRCLLYTSRCV